MVSTKGTGLTPGQSASLAGPRAMKDPGSPDWCYQTVHALQSLWSMADREHDRYLEILSEADNHAIWEKIPPDAPYGSREALLEAIGVGDETSVERRRQEMQVKADTAKPLGAHGQYLARGTTATAYLTARIARDHPDILERMKAGEFSSVRAAAIEAGIIKPVREHKIPHEASHVPALLRKWFSENELEEIIKGLINP